MSRQTSMDINIMKHLLSLLFIVLVFNVSPAQSSTQAPSLEVLEKDFKAAFSKNAELYIDDPKDFYLKIWGRNGNQSSIQSVAEGIKVINLWATWCPPCLEELPSLDLLQSMLGDKEFQVFAVLIDQNDVDKGREYFHKAGLDNLHVYTDMSGRALSREGVKGLPTTFILSPDGKEIGRVTGPAEWNSSEVVHFISQLKLYYYNDSE